MIGRQILHYLILEKIGQGGMGVVYKAEDTKLKRTVALKFLLPHILSSEEERSRFIHEAQAAAALHHPNICTVHEINEIDGQTFIAMAHIDGEGLNERITRGPVEPVETLRIVLQIARGLRAAHKKGIVHRDIKSSNILLADDGRATIMDFGIAKSARRTHATKNGAKMGTIGYMSPEQTRGDEVDHRTDVWSVGVLLYELITGQRPFRGDYDEAVIYSILNEDPEPATTFAPDTPKGIWLAIQRAIAKSPDARYQTMAEMVEDLEVIHEDIRTGGSSSRRRGARVGRVTHALRARRFLNVRTFVLATVLLLAVFVVVRLSPLPGLRGLGAATEMVTALDEAGNPIERSIPTSEARKSIMMYFLDPEMEEEDYEWVGGAMMVLVQVDLFQDQYLYLRSCIDEQARRRLADTGYATWFDAPWSLKREFAEDAHVDYMLTGSYDRAGDEWVFTLRLHDAESGRLVAENTYQGADFFAIADAATVQLRRDVGLPQQHIEDSQDLPISEMLTASLPALKDFCIGIYVALFEQGWREGVDYLERAVAADSTFSWGQFMLFQFYQANNVPGKSDAAMRAAMQHIYKLPERMQFILKINYYGHAREPEKQLGVAQMMVDLYPDAIEAHLALAEMRMGRGEREMAIAAVEKVLEIDPSRSEFIMEIAGQYQALGDFERAAEQYGSYIEKHPDDPEGYYALGGLHEIQGHFDRARQYYEKVLVLDPSHTRVLIDLGDIEGKLSNDERAEAFWNQALASAKRPQDRARVHASMRNYYSNRGQMSKSLEQIELLWNEHAKFLPPVAIQAERLSDMCLFARAGRTDEAFAHMESAKAQLIPPYDGLLEFGYLCIYVELERSEKIAEHLDQLNTYIDTYNIGHLRGEACWAEGNLEETRGDYQAAIRCYERKLVEDPTDVTMHRAIGRCYRKLGQYKEAIASLEKMLEIHPGNPTVNYEMALAYHGLGDDERAMLLLNKALDRWKDAEPVYKPAREARATLAKWKSS
jgi:tetratricopeptide (TPR) repeat protein/predicted Ser/Thr protein kinase